MKSEMLIFPVNSELRIFGTSSPNSLGYPGIWNYVRSNGVICEYCDETNNSILDFSSSQSKIFTPLPALSFGTQMFYLKSYIVRNNDWVYANLILTCNYSTYTNSTLSPKIQKIHNVAKIKKDIFKYKNFFINSNYNNKTENLYGSCYSFARDTNTAAVNKYDAVINTINDLYVFDLPLPTFNAQNTDNNVYLFQFLYLGNELTTAQENVDNIWKRIS